MVDILKLKKLADSLQWSRRTRNFLHDYIITHLEGEKGFDEYFVFTQKQLEIHIFNCPNIIHFLTHPTEDMMTIAYARGVEIKQLSDFMNADNFDLEKIIREGNRYKLLGIANGIFKE